MKFADLLQIAIIGNLQVNISGDSSTDTVKISVKDNNGLEKVAEAPYSKIKRLKDPDLQDILDLGIQKSQ